jgi:hypothetical protein
MSNYGGGARDAEHAPRVASGTARAFFMFRTLVPLSARFSNLLNCSEELKSKENLILQEILRNYATVSRTVIDSFEKEKKMPVYKLHQFEQQ